MRPDMHKVITEKPRRGGGVKEASGYKARLSRIPLDELPTKESMRKKWIANWSGNAKEFTDVLGPLVRFLRSNVGRPWNKIYSEIVEKMPKTNKQFLHIYTHVFELVERDVVMDGKVAYRKTRFGRSYDPAMVFHFYVHPSTGLLCDNQKHYQRRHRFKYRNVPDAVAGPSSDLMYLNIDDIWYEVTVKEVDPIPGTYGRGRSAYDVAVREQIDGWRMTRLYGRFVVAVKKRQLNSREIKRLNLLAA